MVRLLVGLGNPGAAYQYTRHNLGFWVLDRVCYRLSPRRGAPRQRRAYRGRYVELEGPRGPVGLLWPETFMNESGRSVAAARQALGLSPEEILVVVDDLNLDPGRIRIRLGGSSGGHRGLMSIEAELGTRTYPRLRVGIGRPPDADAVAYVLARPPRAEEGFWEEVVGRAAQAVLAVLEEGPEAAMARYNRDEPARCIEDPNG